MAATGVTAASPGLRSVGSSRLVGSPACGPGGVSSSAGSPKAGSCCAGSSIAAGSSSCVAPVTSSRWMPPRASSRRSPCAWSSATASRGCSSCQAAASRRWLSALGWLSVCSSGYRWASGCAGSAVRPSTVSPTWFWSSRRSGSAWPNTRCGGGRSPSVDGSCGGASVYGRMGLPFSVGRGVGGGVDVGQPYRLGPEQFGEERAIVHDRLAKLLGRGLAPLVGLLDVVGFAVLLERAGMLDGQVRDLLVELAGRVPPLCDQLGDQHVCLAHRLVRRVDEADLDLLPRDDVPLAGCRVERAEVQFGVAPLAVAQLPFTGGAAVLLGHDPVVLRAEAGTQGPPPGQEHRADGEEQDDHDNDHDDGDLHG